MKLNQRFWHEDYDEFRNYKKLGICLLLSVHLSMQRSFQKLLALKSFFFRMKQKSHLNEASGSEHKTDGNFCHCWCLQVDHQLIEHQSNHSQNSQFWVSVQPLNASPALTRWQPDQGEELRWPCPSDRHRWRWSCCSMSTCVRTGHLRAWLTATFRWGSEVWSPYSGPVSPPVLYTKWC